MTKIGAIGMGAMGAAIGGRLRTAGFYVCTDVEGRSPTTQARAKSHGIALVSTAEMLSTCDIILSIVPPGEASATARRIASQITDGRPADQIYVDCNAASPASKITSAAFFSETGVDFVDGAIIGEPPNDTFNPTFYFASQNSQSIEVLKSLAEEATQGRGLKVNFMEGKGIGAASALKSSYSGITKGYIALLSAMVISAHKNGALEALLSELKISRPNEYSKIKGLIRILEPRAYRFGPEMDGIANFAEVASASDIYHGIAQFYNHLAADQKGATGDWKTLEEACDIAGNADASFRWSHHISAAI